MQAIQTLLDFAIHLDEHLIAFVTTYGALTYVLLFIIIFCETGIIFTAVLPGDSLLFAAGTLSAASEGSLNVHILFASLVLASVLGNSLNYWIGQWLGPKVFRSNHSWLFNPKHLQKAHLFYQRYGGKTIVLARFVPIIRTFAPFVAGLGYMGYRQLLIYSTLGALLWIGLLVYSSNLFGNIPMVREHFSLVILAIIVLSIVPAGLEVLRQRLGQAAE